MSSKYNPTRVGAYTRRNRSKYRIRSNKVKYNVNQTRRNHNIQQSDFSLKVETVKRMADQKGYQELSQKELKTYTNYIAKGLTKRDMYIMEKYIQAKESSWTYWALFWFVKYLEVSGHIYNEMAKYQQLSHLRNVHRSKIDELKTFEQKEKAKDLIVLKEVPKLEPIPVNANPTNATATYANHVNVASSHINNVNHNSSASAHFMPHRSNTSSSRNSGVIPERAVVQRATVRASLEDIATYFGNVSSVSGTPKMSLLAPNEDCIQTMGIDKCPYILLVGDKHTENPSNLCSSCNVKNGCLSLRSNGRPYTTTPFFRYLNDTLVPKGVNVTVLVEYGVDQTDVSPFRLQTNNPKRSALHQMQAIGQRCQLKQNGRNNIVCEFPNIHFEGVDVRQGTESMNNGDTMTLKLQNLIDTSLRSDALSTTFCESVLELNDSSKGLEPGDTIDLYLKFYEKDATMGDMFRDENYQRTSRTYQELQQLERTSPGAMQFFLDQVEHEPTIPITGDFAKEHRSFPYETVRSFLQAIKDDDITTVREMISNGVLKSLGYQKQFYILNMPAKIVDIFAAAKVLQRSNGELAVLHLGNAHTSNINSMLSQYYDTYYNWAKGIHSWFSFSSAPSKCAKKINT